VSSNTTDNNIATLAEYMNRLPSEYQVMWLKDAVTLWNKTLASSKAFRTLIRKPKLVELLSGVNWDA
jgi:hypothetical protein